MGGGGVHPRDGEKKSSCDVRNAVKSKAWLSDVGLKIVDGLSAVRDRGAPRQEG